MSEPVKPSKSGQHLDTNTWDALKAAGFSEADMQDDQPFGPIIFSYSRKQAIDDGVLIDVTPIANKIGFKLHTVVTCGVISELCDGQHADFNKFTAVHSLLLDLMKAIRLSARNQASDRVDFKHRLHVRGSESDIRELDLYALVGPGDDAEAVLTVMLIGED